MKGYVRKVSNNMQFFFILILKPAFLKIFIMSFRIRSVFYLDVFLKSTSPSSLYKPVNFLVYLIIKIVYVCRQAPRFRRYQTALGDVDATFFIFLFQCSLSLYHKDFVQCFVIRMCFSGMLIYCWVNRIPPDIVR